MRSTCMQLAEVVDSGHWNLACHIAEKFSVIIKLNLLPQNQDSELYFRGTTQSIGHCVSSHCH